MRYPKAETRVTLATGRGEAMHEARAQARGAAVTAVQSRARDGAQGVFTAVQPVECSGVGV